MNDKIIQVDSHEQYFQDMQGYTIYVIYHRSLPRIEDGLKTVQRRIGMTAMGLSCTKESMKRKSAKIVGDCIGTYHPHGDAAVYAAMKPMANWYECKVPLLCYEGNSGSIQGAPQAHQRYTEAYLSKFAVDCVISDLLTPSGGLNENVVDWIPTYDNREKEPVVLPVKVPLLLINGVFGIAVGLKVEVPSHSLNDVIDATLNLMHNPKANVVLIPDPCMKCEIIDTDWKKISNTGVGEYTVRGIVDILEENSVPQLSIKSTPDLVFSDSVVADIKAMIKNNKLPQVADIQDKTFKDKNGMDQLDIRIILKKGSDPNYVKQLIYKNTQMQKNIRVNLMVIVDEQVKRVSYKAYLLSFLEFRRTTKYRDYKNKLQARSTEYEACVPFVKLLESGKVNDVIKKLQTRSDDTAGLINWLVKLLDITPTQAKYILKTELHQLTKSHLMKLREKASRLQEQIREYTNMITDPNAINNEIEQELLRIKAEYGRPRQSILISAAEASNIPSGEFRIILTEGGFIRKCSVAEPVKAYRNDVVKSAIIADNAENIFVFDSMGKAYTLPVNNIPFGDKGTNGIDIRLLIKAITSSITDIFYAADLKLLANKTNKCYMVVTTKCGLIKKLDLNDIITIPPSGLSYAKLNPGDYVKHLAIADDSAEIVIYSDCKAIKHAVADIPCMKRLQAGKIGMKTINVDGVSIVDSNHSNIIVVTESGRFNKINICTLPKQSRDKSGSRVIKLSKNDRIINIHICSQSAVLRVYKTDEMQDIAVKDIVEGSSISNGVKLCKDVLKTELLVEG